MCRFCVQRWLFLLVCFYFPCVSTKRISQTGISIRHGRRTLCLVAAARISGRGPLSASRNDNFGYHNGLALVGICLFFSLLSFFPPYISMPVTVRKVEWSERTRRIALWRFIYSDAVSCYTSPLGGCSSRALTGKQGRPRGLRCDTGGMVYDAPLGT